MEMEDRQDMRAFTMRLWVYGEGNETKAVKGTVLGEISPSEAGGSTIVYGVDWLCRWATEVGFEFGELA